MSVARRLLLRTRMLKFVAMMLMSVQAWAGLVSPSRSTVALEGARPRGRVLVVVSAASAVPLLEGGKHPTGVFLGEIAEPAEAMINAGYALTFVTPGGRRPTLDPDSLRKLYFGLSSRRRNHVKAYYDALLAHGLSSPLALETLSDSDIAAFDALFVPGGHGPLADLLYRDIFTSRELNTDMGRVLAHFHFAGKPTGLLCHSPAVLVTAPHPNGIWIYRGYRMTAISREVERYNENMPFLRVVKGHVGLYPSEILKNEGADYIYNKIPTKAYVVDDRELMTGQDPFAAKLMGERFVEKLNAAIR